MPERVALVTGVTGQDGSYLAEFLLHQGYEVHGMARRSSTVNTWRLDEVRVAVGDDLWNHFHLHLGDLTESGSLIALISTIRPTEIYNLAAQSHVGISFSTAESTADITGTGVARLLEAIRLIDPGIRFYQASSSEMFGSTNPPQAEDSVLHPRSPYACAKVYGHHLTINYRESYDLYAVSGILFNHESPRRGENFVTRKIALGAARIKTGLDHEVRLGNLDAKRDWGYAGDYVEAMWAMLQQDTPDDYVIATGKAWSVQDFCQAAFDVVDLDWRNHVVIDPEFVRPAEVDHLLGDPTKAEQNLAWKPRVDFDTLVHTMVTTDLRRLAAR